MISLLLFLILSPLRSSDDQNQIKKYIVRMRNFFYGAQPIRFSTIAGSGYEQNLKN